MNKKQKPLVWTDPDDAPVWTAEDFEQAEYRIGQTEASREEVQKIVAKRTRGRPKSDQPKVAVKLRLDPDLLAVLRATGDGWQTRINRILRDHFAI